MIALFSLLKFMSGMLEMKDFQEKVMVEKFLVIMVALKQNICHLRFIQKETKIIKFSIKIPHVNGPVSKTT